ITEDVVRFTTTSPGRRRSAASTARARTSSLSSTVPVSSITARRSPSGSWAKPISRWQSRTSAAISPRVSGLGSASRGKIFVGSTEMAQVAAENVAQKSGRGDGTGAIHGIERYAKLALADAIGIHVSQHSIEVEFGRGAVIGNDAANFIVGRLAEIALMIEIDQLGAFVVIEEQPLRIEKLQGVVLGRIVRRGDGDAALRVRSSNVHLNGRRGQDAGFHDFAASGEEATRDGVHQHVTGRAGIAAQDDAPTADISSEGLRERGGQCGREKLAYDAADAGD